jgi:hypothetical protein
MADLQVEAEVSSPSSAAASPVAASSPTASLKESLAGEFRRLKTVHREQHGAQNMGTVAVRLGATDAAAPDEARVVTALPSETVAGTATDTAVVAAVNVDPNQTAISPEDRVQKEVLGPQEQASYISQVFWLWMQPLMNLGSERPLVYADMHPLPSFVRARTTASNFDAAWADEVKKNPTDPSLIQVFKQLFLPRFLRASVNKFLADCLSMVSPQIMSLVIAFVAASKKANPPDIWVGIGLAFAMFVSAFLQTTLTNSFMNTVTTSGICMRSTMVTAIYQKSLRLSQASRCEFSTGQIMNMISADAARLDLMMVWDHVSVRAGCDCL